MEGGLHAPVRHPHGWTEPDYLDQDKIDAEVRRIFDICHGCRRCFNLCDSFPRLFDLIDESDSGELDSVDSKDFKPVMDACTLCDMCFMVSCPYVPPHEFNLDFPHLVLRYRAAENAKAGIPFVDRQLGKTDRNGKMIAPVAPLANWASNQKNKPLRTITEKVAGLHREAALPKFVGKTFAARAKTSVPDINKEAPAFGRKAALYATCFVNYNQPSIGEAAQYVLARNGVETQVAYPGCCGMPKLEHADFEGVAAQAKKVSEALMPVIDEGFDIVALTPSCALMLKFEWPLILPDDPAVKRLAEHTADITQYVVDIAENEGLADGLESQPDGVTVHLACHARAQNIGPKAAEMLRFLPETEVAVVERCSGHGGSWGMKTEFFETALKVGKNAARQALRHAKGDVVSECPLAAEHLLQGMERLSDDALPSKQPMHPIEILARAYGFKQRD